MTTHHALWTGTLVVAVLAALLGCGGGASRVSAASTSTPQTCTSQGPDSASVAQPLVERYCTSCHAPGRDAGDEHDFTQPALLRAQRRLVSARLRAHSMPPSTSPQPSEAERALMMHWADCG